VHTFFILSALLFAAAISGAGAVLLQLAPATGRRPLALVTLAAPPIVLGLAVVHLIPHFWPDCAPLVGWDRVATFALLGTLGPTESEARYLEALLASIAADEEVAEAVQDSQGLCRRHTLAARRRAAAA